MNQVRIFAIVALWSLGAINAVHAAATVAPPEDLSEIKTKMNAAQSGDPEKKPGAAVYREHCSQCHEGQAQKAPIKTFLGMMTPEAIYDALSIGIMRPLAARLTVEQKHHVAEYLSGSPVGTARVPIAPTCSGDAADFDRAKVPTTAGWGQTPDNDHFVDAGTAKLAVTEVPKLKLKWAVAFPNTMRVRSRPTLACTSTCQATCSRRSRSTASESRAGRMVSRWMARAVASSLAPGDDEVPHGNAEVPTASSAAQG